MNILGHGIDLASSARLKASLENSHFEARVFSPMEASYCRTKANPYPHFAARFAAKEAFGKAMGLGLGASGAMLEVEVVNNERGAPALRLTGGALEKFKSAGGGEIFLSLTHEGELAMASVIVTRA